MRGNASHANAAWKQTCGLLQNLGKTKSTAAEHRPQGVLAMFSHLHPRQSRHRFFHACRRASCLVQGMLTASPIRLLSGQKSRPDATPRSERRPR
jgi:hypothetical protein